MFVSYMDEAGHFRNPNSLYVGMAGFIAPEEIWGPFGKWWRAIVEDQFRLKKPFHMMDFAHRKGEFAGWSESERQNLLSSLIEAILLSELVPIASVVSIADYKSLSRDQQTVLKSPYNLCFQVCTRGAAIFAGPGPEDSVKMVYSENLEYGAIQSQPNTPEKQRGNSARLWHAMKSMTIHGQWMHSCTFSTPTDTVQLQAADLFAYEICKEFESQRKRPDAPMRWGLRQILKLVDLDFVMIRLFNRKELLRLIIEAGFVHREGTEEVGDIDAQMFQAQFERAEWIKNRAAQFDAKHPPAAEK